MNEQTLKAVIWHNPACGTSRNTLAMLKEAGCEIEVVEYLKAPPSREELASMIAEAGLSVRDALREKGTPYHDLGLGDESLPDDALLETMLAHPILINRPFVKTRLGVRLCRPSEKVLEILPEGAISEFTKEDGGIVQARPGR